MPSAEKSIQEPASVDMPRRPVRARNRIKLSTTVAAENFSFLETMVSTGRSDSIAEAVDLAIARLRRVENRAQLEAATAAYFDGLSPDAEAEEQAMTGLLHGSARGVDFDLEP